MEQHYKNGFELPLGKFWQTLSWGPDPTLLTLDQLKRLLTPILVMFPFQRNYVV